MIRNPVMAADTTVVEGSKWCPRCERAKPLEQFAWCPSERRHYSWCRQCKRHYNAAQVRTKSPEQREKFLAYLREWNADPIRVQRRRDYRRTPIGKLITNRTHVRWKIRRKPTDYLRAKEIALTAEIERLRGDE